MEMRSFFQEFETDENDDSIIRCKMHDIMHAFAQLLRKGECYVVASTGIEERRPEWCHENARHLRVILDNEQAAIPSPLYNAKKLRTLLVDSCPYNRSTLNALTRLFGQLTCLGTLELSNNRFRRQTSMTELPSEIGKLILLRYLSLEGNKDLEYLPETLGNLRNLQSLNIRLCSGLKSLPSGIGRLINLRHLQNAETYACTSIVCRLERLTLLQTLEEFVADDSSLASLGRFPHLRGNLKITGLGDVREQTAAGKAELWKKTGLRNLTLSFNSTSKEKGGLYILQHPFHSLMMRSLSSHEASLFESSVLEALQPPPYLESLNINRMNGPTAFPCWMVSLTMLKRVILWACLNWESLPPMWKLPVLEHLEIWEMKNVKEVGQEFMGAETENGQASSSSSSVNTNIAFPSLKHLKFQLMEEWQEWDYGNLLTTMPLLCSLKINSCLKLKSLPRQILQKTTLQVLDIFDCLIPKERCSRNGTGEDWPDISHIPTITIDGEDVQRDGF